MSSTKHGSFNLQWDPQSDQHSEKVPQEIWNGIGKVPPKLPRQVLPQAEQKIFSAKNY